MPTTDRRHALRTKLDQVAYIHIEPDNGAIVLNASGDGLCFHSMAPVDPTAPLRFSVKEQNRRVDVCGELVWTDELQKIGGVRFHTVTAEVREQVLDWIRKSGSAPAEHSTLGAALLKALPANGSRRAFSLKPALAWWRFGKRLKVSGFLPGLASGFMLSMLAFSVVLFFYGHRREFGESLVRLGEQLGASRDPGVAPQTAPSATSTSATARSNAVSARSATSEKRDDLVQLKSSSTGTPAKDKNASSDEMRAATVPAATRTANQHQHTQAALLKPNLERAKTDDKSASDMKSVGSSQSPMPMAISAPSLAAVASLARDAQASNSKPDQHATLMHTEAVASVALGIPPQNARSDVQMFFDVGRFKKRWMAQDLSNKVTQLGIRTSIVQRGRLWMSSYQVLAGPYNNEGAETQLKEELLSHGYDPRPYERGSRDFSFRSKVTVHGSQLPAGDFSIGWETYVADTKVKFIQGRYVVSMVNGKWVRRDSKFLNNEYVYRIQHDASRPLLEIHFAGMNRALVLQNLP